MHRLLTLSLASATVAAALAPAAASAASITRTTTVRRGDERACVYRTVKVVRPVRGVVRTEWVRTCVPV